MLSGSPLHVMEHPLVRHKLTLLRDITTGRKEFRELTEEVTYLIGYEATRKLATCVKPVETPFMKAKCEVLSEEVCIVPVLRAGLGMVNAMLRLLPNAYVGHLGLYRDHATLDPVEYYCKTPQNPDKMTVMILDPILATGGSASAAVSALKERGAKKIMMICLIGSPEGSASFLKKHPDTELYLGAMEEFLDSRGFVLPGMGDAGDRLFGTR